MRCRSGSYLSTSQFVARTRGNVRKEKIQKKIYRACPSIPRWLTCGVNANILSCKEYSLLVLRIPTSLDLRPDKPSFSLRPKTSGITRVMGKQRHVHQTAVWNKLEYVYVIWLCKRDFDSENSLPKYVYRWLSTFAGCTSIGATSAIVCTWMSCCAIFSLISVSSAKMTTCTTTSGFFSLHSRLLSGSNSPTARNPCNETRWWTF